jgi:hypothetical protein
MGEWKENKNGTYNRKHINGKRFSQYIIAKFRFLNLRTNGKNRSQ